MLSGRLPYSCDSCNKVLLVDVELDQFAKGTPQKCPACASTLKPKFGDREVLPLASLTTGRPSDEVRSYLGRHPHAPSVDRSAEWTNALGLTGTSSAHGTRGDPHHDATQSLPPTVQVNPVQMLHTSDTGLVRRPGGSLVTNPNPRT